MKAFAPSSFGSAVMNEMRESRSLFLIIASFTVITFASIPALNGEWALRLSAEDGFYEYLTAIIFLAASLICFLVFRRQRNVWFLLLSLFLFAGFGEEISWGQRIFGFATPEFIDKVNVQHEFTIHNLEPVNSIGYDGAWKSDWRRLVTVNNMFRGVCLLYGIVLPLGFMYSGSVRTLVRKLKLPLPPLSLGIFFLIAYLLLRVVVLYTVPESLFPWRDAGEEVFECCTSLVWLVISLFFLKAAGKQAARPEERVVDVMEPFVEV